LLAEMIAAMTIVVAVLMEEEILL